jgi:ketosteroid isomerase-like protein
MSQENVEIVRVSNEAWVAGDLEGLRETYDPDVVMRTVEEWPEAGPHFGREAVCRFLEQLRDTWQTGEPETIILIDARDRVVGQYRWHGLGRGPDSNIEVSQILTFRKGKIVMVEYFWDHAEALEAVELSEQDAQADSS